MALAVIAIIGTAHFGCASVRISARGTYAVKLGHLHVHKDDIIVAMSHCVDRLMTVLGNMNLVSGLFQQCHSEHLIDFVVLRQKDT